MPIRSGSITKSSPRTISEQDTLLIEALTKSRLVQGWNLQTPADAKLTVSVWKEQFNLHKIRPVLYSKLVDMSVEHQTKEIAQGRQPTPITAALMIQCYHRYRLLKLEELARINANIQHYRSLRHRYQQGDINLEEAVRQAKYHKEIEHESFVKNTDFIISELEKKRDMFMEVNGLDG